MSMLDGGPWRCTLTDFESTDPMEINRHAKECGKHTMSGTTICINCGERLEFKGLPYVPFKEDGSKGLVMRCNECETIASGNVKVTKTVKVEEPNEE